MSNEVWDGPVIGAFRQRSIDKHEAGESLEWSVGERLDLPDGDVFIATKVTRTPDGMSSVIGDVFDKHGNKYETFPERILKGRKL